MPVISATTAGMRLMREGGRGAQILMPAPLPLKGKGGGGKGGGGGAKAAVAKVGRARTGAKGAGGGGPGEGGGGGGELDAAGEALLSRLQAWRKAVCAADGVPAYRVLGNRGLEEVARLRPRTRGALAAVHGIGPVKLDKYADAILEAVKDE